MKSLMAAVQLGAVLAGQCTDSDYQFWASYGRTFSNFLTGCAKKEWGNAEKTSQCLLDDPMNKLSGSCATCFGDFQGCAKIMDKPIVTISPIVANKPGEVPTEHLNAWKSPA
ncbi:hypothetical protein FOL47_009417 [Perkinsus chesapeaki]|uniref:Secreted protein n=1 Tax=Perkinsus chesapeaki TaxID=330153 RepID=A0A7J6L8I2_PERCH|nr:hypothetical protein FOL47_009417 [Perkinsus chesapeaki]